MQAFTDLINNELLFWGLVACISAQFLKVIFNFFANGEVRFGVIYETGGMSSSHSSLISGLVSGLGWNLGFDDPLFALGVGIALIVMYDASGVRRSAGLHAVEINRISSQISETSEVNLKEKLGHTKLEVIVGSVIGPLITLPGIEFLGSPLDIYHDLIRNFF